jgi:hypothetical protein
MIAIGLLFVRCCAIASSRDDDWKAEILVLRYQLSVLQQRMPHRVRLRWADRVLFIWLYRPYPLSYRKPQSAGTTDVVQQESRLHCTPEVRSGS